MTDCWFLFGSYAGDANVKAKVKGIVCGIKDIQFVGELRIILSPLINTIPLFGALTYFFLKNPVRAPRELMLWTSYFRR